MKFDLGAVVATPGALSALAEAGQTARDFIGRHMSGDWGEVDAEDAASNDAAVSDGGRLLSAYMLRTGVRIWAITEAVGNDGRRAATTLLLPDEY